MAYKMAGFVVIEYDHESELNFARRLTPALKSLDTEQRVIYLGSLSKTLAHGLRLGFTLWPMAFMKATFATSLRATESALPLSGKH